LSYQKENHFLLLIENKDEMEIVTYNVLSPNLATPAYYPWCKPENLDKAVRIERIKVLLRKKMDSGAIICLQEVAFDFAEELYPFFDAADYFFETNHYGKPSSGYMGVGIAFPRSMYALEGFKVVPIALTKEWPVVDPLIGRISLVSLVKNYLFPEKVEMDDWERARQKPNQMLCVKLRRKDLMDTFTVCTYHMPCEFTRPWLMNIHTSLVASAANAYAGDSPLVLAGDFNFKPGSSMYRLMTTGNVDDSNAEYPPPRAHDPWRLGGFRPLRSAYKEYTNKEPAFTNYARSVGRDAFIDTLDYIFVSEDWTVKGVGETPVLTDDYEGPLPSSTEPSDHILISAILSL
jgi:mRNA deadenylase 3'-5' endonuclease subunit Ccr4